MMKREVLMNQIEAAGKNFGKLSGYNKLNYVSSGVYKCNEM